MLRARLSSLALSAPGSRAVRLGVPRISQARNVRAVIEAHIDNRRFYQPSNLSASWNMLGKLVRSSPSEADQIRRSPAMLRPLATDTAEALPSFNERTLSSTVNGLASLHRWAGWDAGDALWNGLAMHSASYVHKMTSQGLSNTAHGFAKRGHAAPELFDALAAEAAPRLHEFTPQGLSLIHI